jgi:hypothetical protein
VNASWLSDGAREAPVGPDDNLLPLGADLRNESWVDAAEMTV